MRSLAQDLKSINSTVTTSDTREKPMSFGDAQELFREALTNTQSNWKSPPDNITKHIHHSFSGKFLEDWMQRMKFQSISIVQGVPALPILDKGFAQVPIQQSLSIRDNVYTICRCLEMYYRETYKNTFHNSHYASNPFNISIHENSLSAISTWMVYHYFIFQTITEDFTVDVEKLSPEVLNERIKNGYKVISQISSLLEHLPLVMLDNLSTISLHNPFYIDSDTNEISIKPEVITILKMTTKFFVSMQSWNTKTQSSFQELSELIYKYTHDHDSMINMMGLLSESLDFSDRRLHWCPVHNVDNGSTSLFQNLFKISMDSFKEYYIFLSKVAPEIRNNADVMDGSNTIKKLDDNAYSMLETIVKIAESIEI